VDDRLTSLCGDSSVLSGFAAEFDIVLANINRNILLADMPRFVSVMAPHSTLILSGFYESDCTLLESKAQQLGLKLISTRTDGDWASMVFQ
jgi:ribosomal protein L11 methyltransferase